MPGLQFDMFPTDVRFERIDVDRNMFRYYAMTIQPDLFGGADLVRQWGRIGAPGRMVSENYRNESRAVDALVAMAQRKRRRGYV
jgi:predicted DNA-binding WGR domain protein